MHEIGRPPNNLSGPGALKSLRAATDYANNQPIGALASFRIEDVSLPEPGWSPILLEQLWNNILLLLYVKVLIYIIYNFITLRLYIRYMFNFNIYFDNILLIVLKQH